MAEDGKGHLCRPILINCGQCIGCRIAKAEEWAKRLCLEAKKSKNNFFLTLTYNDAEMKWKESGYPSLCKKDLQLFNKRLRRSQEYHFENQNVRFFLSGEYGDKTFRPHYHAIYYNLIIPDLDYYKANEYGDALFTSNYINKIWGKGFVIIGDVTKETCSYVARYCIKKMTGENAKEEYEALGIEEEFSLQSRKPGIGTVDNVEEIYKNDTIYMLKNDGTVKKAKPPKFLDNKLKEQNPELLEEIKRQRAKKAISALEKEVEGTSLSELEYLTVKEKNTNAKMKIARKDKIL